MGDMRRERRKPTRARQYHQQPPDREEGEEPVHSDGEVLEMVRECLGTFHPFDPEEYPPSKRELWVDSDKEAFFFPHRCPGRGGAL